MLVSNPAVAGSVAQAAPESLVRGVEGGEEGDETSDEERELGGRRRPKRAS